MMRLDLSLCTVRSWESRDVAGLTLHADCRDVWLNLRDGFPHPYRESDAREFIEFCATQHPETNFAVEVSGQAAGAIGFRLGEDVERVSAEVGYWLGSRHWGRGIMTQALQATRDYAIDKFELTRIYAVPFEWSKPSIRVLEKAGFTPEGRLRRSAIKDGRIIDQLMYSYVIPAQTPTV